MKNFMMHNEKRKEKNPHNFVSKAEKRRFEADPKRAKAIRKRHYLSIGGVRCPNCDSSSIEQQPVQLVEPNKIHVKVNCENCLAEWKDVYNLTNIILKEDEK